MSLQLAACVIPFHGTSRRTGAGAWTDSDMQGGPVDELLDVAVKRPALDQLEVEVCGTLKDRFHPGLTGDHREERHLDAVDQTRGHQRPVHRQTAVRAQRDVGLLLEPGDDVDGITAYEYRVRPVKGAFQGCGHHRCRYVPHLGVHWVELLQFPGARAQQLHKLPEGVGPQHHPLRLTV